MKKVAVTGGAGFIGQEVVSQLLEKGYFVRVIDNLSKHNKKPLKYSEFLNLDLTDKKNAEQALDSIDTCIHLAAKIGGIGYFHTYPATILSENNKMYSAVFESAVKNKIDRMVYISSSMVFESTKKFPSAEKDLLATPPPISSYGFSKLIGEQYCKAFNQEYGLQYTICRPFNAYGVNEYPGDEVGYAHVIPDLTKKIFTGQYPIELLGDGKQIRCFTHVKDLAAGIIATMESPKAINEDFNIASNEPITMEDLAKKIWKLSQNEKPFKATHVPSFPQDVKGRIPDVSKMETIVGWKAKITLDEGLAETTQWLKEAING